MSSSPSFLDPIVLPLVRGDCVLDVACGFGRWGCLLRTNYFECGLSAPPIVDGLDAFEPNVVYAQELGVYRKVWLAKLPCALPRGIYATILASEVLEHLPIEAAEKALDEFEAAALTRVIVTTPNWECLREGSDTFLGKNDFDQHLSFIPKKLLRNRGYQIFGAGWGNPRTLSVKLAVSALRLFGVKDFTVLDSLSKNLPSLAHTIVAVKDVRKGAR